MIRHVTAPRLLIVVGIALVVGPALFPVQPVLLHNTAATTNDGPDELERQGFEVVAYENLSDRGQELYVEALRNDGRYMVPVGEGAPEFAYPTREELSDVDDFEEMNRMRAIVVERPADDDHLPPADERVHGIPYRGGEERPGETGPTPTEPGATGSPTATGTPGGTGTPDGAGPTEPYGQPDVDEEQVKRYDVMHTSTERPPLDHRSNLLRLLSILSGGLAVGIGGYLGSRP